MNYNVIGNPIDSNDNFNNLIDINDFYLSPEFRNENIQHERDEQTYLLNNNAIQQNTFTFEPGQTHLVLNISSMKGDFSFLNKILRLTEKNNVQYEIYSTINSGDETISTNKSKKTYSKFTNDEDNLLKGIVNTFGPKNWRLISTFIPRKTPKQCRDRYMNYLIPGVNHSDWSKEEDMLLVQKYNEIGPHWSQIKQYFPLRTANSIKNRFNYTICKNLNNIKDQI